MTWLVTDEVDMNLSGIIVAAKPEWLANVVADLNALPGVEVHQVDEATGRIVVVQEAADIPAEVDGLERIQRLPHVLMAQLVYHYFADDPAIDAFTPGPADTTSDPVPAVLNNS